MPGRSPLYAVAQLSAKPHRSVAADRRRESFARRYGGYIVPIAYIQLTKAVFPRSDNRSIRLQPQSKTFACRHRDNIAPRAHVQLSEFIPAGSNDRPISAQTYNMVLAKRHADNISPSGNIRLFLTIHRIRNPYASVRLHTRDKISFRADSMLTGRNLLPYPAQMRVVPCPLCRLRMRWFI